MNGIVNADQSNPSDQTDGLSDVLHRISELIGADNLIIEEAEREYFS